MAHGSIPAPSRQTYNPREIQPTWFPPDKIPYVANNRDEGRRSAMPSRFFAMRRRLVISGMVVATLLAGGSQILAQTGITVSVQPTSATVQVPGGTQQFTATVRNDRRHRGVRWTLNGTGCSGRACGTLSANTSGSGIPITYPGPATVPN